ncbi:MAG: DsbE family thiol:disulfide interchange protein [Alphaproteobacteria bacterium]|nr:DsbE family thiol:disulfide interchange protein [Alphaproteobacteria bacterium]
MTPANAPQGATTDAARPLRPARWRRFRLVFVLPAIAFVGLALAFGVSLDRGRDPSMVPSALIGKPVPAFSLPPVKGTALGLSTADLKGAVSLVNVFASWCVACREEHPLLMRLKARGVVPIYGIDYKDKPDDAARWLATMGNPYDRVGADLDGWAGIDWGVYGVPETYVIDRDGRIAFKQIGPITPTILDGTILPLVEKLRR